MTLLPNKLKLISLSTGLPQRVVKEVIQRFTDLAVHDLLAEGRFHHRGLGTFKVVHRRPRNITRVFGKKDPGQKPLQVPAPERGAGFSNPPQPSRRRPSEDIRIDGCDLLTPCREVARGTYLKGAGGQHGWPGRGAGGQEIMRGWEPELSRPRIIAKPSQSLLGFGVWVDQGGSGGMWSRSRTGPGPSVAT